MKFALDNIELRKANGRGWQNRFTGLMIASLMYASGYKDFINGARRDSEIKEWLFSDENPSLDDYSKIITFAHLFVK